MTRGLPGTSKVAPVAERRDLMQLGGAKPTAQQREPQKAKERPEFDRAEALRRVRHLATRQRSVGFVNRHRDCPLAPQPLREADVVRMPVSQNQRTDIGGRPAHRGQFPVDVAVVAGHARVNNGHLPGLLDQVGIDHAVAADPVDARSNLHDRILPPGKMMSGPHGVIATTAPPLQQQPARLRPRSGSWSGPRPVTGIRLGQARIAAVMLGSRLVRHDHEHHPEGGVLCRWQLAVDVAGLPGRAGAFLAYGGRRPGLRPSSKSWRRHPRPAMSGRPSNGGSASLSGTGSATRLAWCLP
jgi:hypothetical protein